MSIDSQDRRKFSLGLAAGSVISALPSIALGQQKFDEGIDYRVVQPAVPTSSPGKIEVLEFFWYACPHCYRLNPFVAEWKKKLPANVEFKKVHVAFRGDGHQKIFYTLEAMGREADLGIKVFEEIHLKKNPMASLIEASAWAKTQGLDVAKFEATWNSFAVQTQQKRANALVNSYKLDGVPMFGINGRFLTSPSMVGGSHARALQVVDYLISRSKAA
jgi:protein dithiol oxidoreductase (disulfide-forming)